MGSKFNHLTTQQKSEIIMLYKQRVSNTEIAKRTNVSRRSVQLWVHRFAATGNIGHEARGPKVQGASSTHHRAVMETYKRDPCAPIREIAKSLYISPQTVRRHLHLAGVPLHRPLKCSQCRSRNSNTGVKILNGKVVCPNCSADIEVEDRQQEKLNAMLVRVYSYFASTNAGLSHTQLQKRTALCSGVSKDDVERALEVHHQAQYAGAPARKRWRIRKRKSNTPSPEQQEQSGQMEDLLEERVFVQNENDTSNEENPLYNEDTKPDVADIPVPLQDPSSSPVQEQSGQMEDLLEERVFVQNENDTSNQLQCETEHLETLYLKTEPQGKLRTYPSHRSRDRKSKHNS
ncbi:unnamed protein product [Spodoptera littoralis]|uniref:Uncharacterized protein n=1 Tax=Spodoptera littoralis TaxID=7109 RepID=A0A9P0N592_SPOLI|nr:unnamed protein product [Spodoptera littoralis]CAH1642033.1 unnamed protein product [Spodoptera littoralis]